MHICPRKTAHARLWVAACALLAAAGCGGRQFDVVRTATADVAAGTALDRIDFTALEPLTILDDVLLRRQGVGRSDITQVRLRRMTLTVMAPGASRDLTFCSTVTAAVQGGGQSASTPAVLPQTVAQTSTLRDGENMTALDVEPIELAAYFADADPTFVLTAPGAIAPQNMTLRVEMTLAVEVTSSHILVE